MFRRRKVEADGAARIETLIGRHVSIQGDIRFRGGLHIDGRVSGSVRAVAEAGSRDGSLSLSEHGRVDGSIAATHLVLNGRVEGDVSARERVVLGSKADVRGDVQYGVIEMALGARVRGRLIPRGAADPAGAAVQAEDPPTDPAGQAGAHAPAGLAAPADLAAQPGLDGPASPAAPRARSSLTPWSRPPKLMS